MKKFIAFYWMVLGAILENFAVKHFAKIKLGSMLSDIRGKINGHVYSKNRSGNYVKTKTNPINRNTSAQAAVRAFFSTLTKGWAALTAAQRASWTSAVNAFKQINSLGDAIALTGHQLYIAINRNLQTIGSATITTAPFPAVVTPVATSSVAAAAGAATMTLTYTPAVPALDTWIIEATRAMSAGKASNSQDFKKIDTMVAADVSPFDIKAAYEVVFGASWKTAGAKIFYRLTPTVTASGLQATPVVFSAIVAA